MWAMLLGGNFLCSCYRNFCCRGRRSWFPKASIVASDVDQHDESIPLVDVCHVAVTGIRPWEVEPGQYVYLWIPGVSLTSVFQSHPFCISWWERSDEEPFVLHLLVRTRRGFTSRLRSEADQCFSAMIGGPYGQSAHGEAFGTVLMFATDIGVASLLPYLKSVMQGRKNASICTRRVVLTWQVRKTGVTGKRGCQIYNLIMFQSITYGSKNGSISAFQAIKVS